MPGSVISMRWLYMAVLASGLPWAASATTRADDIKRIAIDVIRVAQVTDMELDVVRDQITRIWLQEGVVIRFAAAPPEVAEARLRLVIMDVQRPSSSPSVCAFGAIRFVNDIPDSELKVFVRPIREFVRKAQPTQSPGVQALEAARIIGRVAAHELGHYLRADMRHQPSGLMRARFDGADLLSPHLKPFRPPLVGGSLQSRIERRSVN